MGQVFNQFSEESTKEMIRKKFMSNNDTIEILSDSYRLSLMCPISKQKIQLPTRGLECSHIECFDLISFLKVASSDPCASKKCPLCKKNVKLDALKVDNWLLKITCKLFATSSTEVNVLPNATWTEVRNDEAECSYILIN